MEQNEKAIDSRKSMTDNATKCNTSGVGIAISHKYSITNTVLVPIGIILK
jgi:hypothetical protein